MQITLVGTSRCSRRTSLLSRIQSIPGTHLQLLSVLRWFLHQGSSLFSFRCKFQSLARIPCQPWFFDQVPCLGLPQLLLPICILCHYVWPVGRRGYIQEHPPYIICVSFHRTTILGQNTHKKTPKNAHQKWNMRFFAFNLINVTPHRIFTQTYWHPWQISDTAPTLQNTELYLLSIH